MLNKFHAAVRWIAHYALVPVVAVLKGLTVGLGYLHDELAKI